MPRYFPALASWNSHFWNGSTYRPCYIGLVNFPLALQIGFQTPRPLPKAFVIPSALTVTYHSVHE